MVENRLNLSMFTPITYRACLTLLSVKNTPPMIEAPVQAELIVMPPQPTVDERLAQALDVIDRRFNGDFEAFAELVSPPAAPARAARNISELESLVGKCLG